MTKNRLEAFSDGVLAIIITIMVLELKAPEGTHWAELTPLLGHLGSYALSFIYLAIYWGNHHHLVHTARRINAKIIWANMHLLFWLSLIPFVTNWVGESQFDPLTVAAYGFLMIMSAIAYTILGQVIISDYDCETTLSKALRRQNVKGYISLALYIGAMLLAFVNTYFSYALYVAVAVMWIVPDKAIEKALREMEA